MTSTKKSNKTPHMDAFTKKMATALKEEGPMTMFQSIDDWMFEAQKAVVLDEAGLALDEEITVEVARRALRKFWQESRQVHSKSTSVGSNMLQVQRVRALRDVADDFKVDEMLLEMVQLNKGNDEPVN